MLNLYFTYRRIWDNETNRYDVSYYNNLQYSDIVTAGLTEMIDGSNFIPDERITKEIVPGIQSLRRAGVLKYNENVFTELEMKESLINVAKSFSLDVLTAEQMKEWIRSNCDLLEVSDGKFKLSDETTGIDGQLVEATYLGIV